MFAIIDIETTGGSAVNSRITEIAILLHDGKEVVKQYSTLINPQCPIPYFITQCTGINDEMVRDAPAFHEVAKDILELTEGAVFVAHNVRFDYSFVKAAFKDLGYNYQRKTLCTVRLSRSTFKGLPSYSLGNLCERLNININNRHRALGDAEATAILFGRIIEQNNAMLDPDWIPSEIKKTSIPPLLPEAILRDLPEECIGVYYFHNQKGDVIYVGKSKDIKKRVIEHFTLKHKASRKSIQLLNEVADISYEHTGSELIALLLESDEIKRLKPVLNSAQKRTRGVPFYGIYRRTDEAGYINLYFEALKEGEEPLRTSDTLYNARDWMYQMIERYNLCLSKCNLHNTPGPCFNQQIHKCFGACVEQETAGDYNARVESAIDNFSFKNESFFLVGEGRHDSEKSIVCIERGQYKGFGYIDVSFGQPSIDDMRSAIKKYNHNHDIQRILCAYLRKKQLKINY